MAKKNIFKNVFMPKVDTNRFDLSHDHKLSFRMGYLIPTCVMECLPGDKVSLSVENMLRFAPLISPVFHKVRVTTHYFFCPNRLIWPDWEKWITGDSDVEAPYITFSDPIEIQVGSLADYLGYPTGTHEGDDVRASPMPMAAYLKIWDEFYRDQNLQTEQFVPLVPGDNDLNYLHWVGNEDGDRPLKRAWEHDYFTSALPFAQKGDSVQLPLTVANDVPVDYQFRTGGESQNTGIMRKATDGTTSANGDVVQSAGPAPLTSGVHVDGNAAAYDPNGTLVVDIQTDAVDINTVRRAFRLQEWLEKNARGGTRYIENILAHFGIKSSDSRLQRPELIGTSRQNMVISEVLSTAETTAANVPVGQMAGHGISVGGGNQFRYSCEEHGYIIGIINVQPDTAYQQGLHRSFSRFDKLDYAWPTFANIGEQEILLKELYMTPTVGSPNAIFGYIPRYSEYKFMNSRVSGQMRTSLAYWHMGRIFGNQPALNEQFISADPSTRIFAVTDEDEDHIFAHIFNNISAVRKLPRYGIPTI